MIDLNKIPTDRLTKEDLLNKFSEYDIFKHYIGDFDLSKTYKSPLRRGDEIPSFNIFYSRRHDCLLFKDFAGKRGDCIKFVQELFSLATYNEAITKIATDMHHTYSIDRKPVVVLSKAKEDYDLKIRKRQWERRDKEFWDIFGISLPTLQLYNVVPIEGYFHNERYVITKDISYAYLEYKDKILTYKIYRPTADKTRRWRNNNPFGVHAGYTQLPHMGELLIITKSLKDVMAIYENLSVPAVSVQSETCFIKDSVVNEYKFRFDHVVTLFDNDRQGIEQAHLYEKLYDIPYIFIPEKYGVKDFSDLIKMIGKYNAKEILKELL